MAQPTRAGVALGMALVFVVALNVAIGGLLATWYSNSPAGVQQLILLNLRPGAFREPVG